MSHTTLRRAYGRASLALCVRKRVAEVEERKGDAHTVARDREYREAFLLPPSGKCFRAS